MDIRQLLIANRGEIAVRVIRACRELGIEPVAVYEPADAGALHVELADRRVPVASYLDAGALVAAAAGCDAVHPGYGYLAENADFAAAVQRAGLAWIGPPAAAMRAVGDKIEARRLAEAAGVAVVPGYAGIALDDDTLLAEGERLGLPLLVKAAAGGGGRGMREVADAAELADAIAAARREAAAAFGDDRVFLERRLDGARHVEVQVLVRRTRARRPPGRARLLAAAPPPEDRGGVTVAGGGRPSCGRRSVMPRCGLAAAAGYVGAGTAEFLLGEDGGWNFLEMNARLQVEHPVTEAVTGHDLVRAQIEVAAGQPLGRAGRCRPRGHAIECRLYAEDPANGFLPRAGGCGGSRCRSGRASAAIAASVPATRSGCATTRCWPS